MAKKFRELKDLRDMLESPDLLKKAFMEMDEATFINELTGRIDKELCRALANEIYRLSRRKVDWFFDDLIGGLSRINIEPIKLKVSKIEKTRKNLKAQIYLRKFLKYKRAPIKNLVKIYDETLDQVGRFNKLYPLSKYTSQQTVKDVEETFAETFFSALVFAKTITENYSPSDKTRLFEEIVIKRYMHGDKRLSQILRNGKKLNKNNTEGLISIESVLKSLRRFIE